MCRYICMHRFVQKKHGMHSSPHAHTCVYVLSLSYLFWFFLSRTKSIHMCMHAHFNAYHVWCKNVCIHMFCRFPTSSGSLILATQCRRKNKSAYTCTCVYNLSLCYLFWFLFYPRNIVYAFKCVYMHMCMRFVAFLPLQVLLLS